MGPNLTIFSKIFQKQCKFQKYFRKFCNFEKKVSMVDELNLRSKTDIEPPHQNHIKSFLGIFLRKEYDERVVDIVFMFYQFNIIIDAYYSFFSATFAPQQECPPIPGHSHTFISTLSQSYQYC